MKLLSNELALQPWGELNEKASALNADGSMFDSPTSPVMAKKLFLPKPLERQHLTHMQVPLCAMGLNARNVCLW